MLLIKNILVATDFSQPSEAAMLYGRNFAHAYGATLHVIHVVDDVAARVLPMNSALQDLGTLQQDLITSAKTDLQALITDDDRRSLNARSVVLTSGTPAQAIVGYARETQIDLLVLGTHGRTGLAHLFMGSVAQHVVRMAPCPVLTVRHPEREFVAPDALVAVQAAEPKSHKPA